MPGKHHSPGPSSEPVWPTVSSKERHLSRLWLLSYYKEEDTESLEVILSGTLTQAIPVLLGVSAVGPAGRWGPG